MTPSGNLFRREWFEIVDDWPREVSSVVRAWDDAATRDGGDWTVGVLMARARLGVFYFIDVVRIQGSPLDVERLKARTAETDADLTAQRAAILLQQEPGAAGKSFIDAQITWSSALPKDQSLALFREAFEHLLQGGLKIEELAQVVGPEVPSIEVTGRKLDDDDHS